MIKKHKQNLNSLFYRFCLSLDLWNPKNDLNPTSRASITGYSFTKSVCGSFRYSIIEDEGFNNIQNAAHELGHVYVK